MITQERWRLVKKEGEAGKISLIEKKGVECMWRWREICEGEGVLCL